MIFLLIAACSTQQPAVVEQRQRPPATVAAPARSRVPPVQGLHLQALVATSGDASSVLDGDPTTGWVPKGNPVIEGVLFRFEKPTEVSRVDYTACDGTRFQVQPYVNGRDGGVRLSVAAGKVAQDTFGGRSMTPPPSIRSYFVRVNNAEGTPCLGEVEFYDRGKRLSVQPPRTIAASVSATSVLTPEDAYHPAYLYDGRTDFGWVEGSPDLGVGDSITLSMDAEVEVVSIELWNGYQRSDDHFKKNARAQQIAVTIGEKRAVLDVPDTMGSSQLRLPAATHGTEVKLEILKAIPGTKYKDLVLSEMRLWDADGPLAFRIKGMDKRAARLKSQVTGTAVEPALDALYVSYCTDLGLRKLKLRSNHSFVWYDEQELGEWDGETSSPSSEVFSGAWVYRDTQEKRSTIQLFGRRHRTSTLWGPYGMEDGEASSVKIGGGKPAFTRVSDLGAEGLRAQVREVRRAHGRDCEYDYAKLVSGDAIVVRGASMTDIMWRWKCHLGDC